MSVFMGKKPHSKVLAVSMNTSLVIFITFSFSTLMTVLYPSQFFMDCLRGADEWLTLSVKSLNNQYFIFILGI